MKPFTTPTSLDRQLQPSPEMRERLAAVERIVGYDFENKMLLEEALTHPSFPRSASYNRLRLLGNSALNHALTKYFFCESQKFNEYQITKLRSATSLNINLARVAAGRGLYRYLLRHNTPALDDQVTKFTEGVINGREMGCVKGHKVLAHIVKSVAAAIYIDFNYDLDELWKIFKPLLELEESDCMIKTKESDSMLGYIASRLYTLGAKAYRVIISLLEFCLNLVFFCFSLFLILVIVSVLAKLVGSFAN